MRQLVFGILPGMRGEHQRHGEPPLRLAHGLTMVGKDDLLTHDPLHLRAESLIGMDQVNATFIGQSSGSDCLLVERRDDSAMDVFGDTRLRIGYTKLQRLKGFQETVGTHFVWVPHPRTQVRVRSDGRKKRLVHGKHG